MEDGTHTFSLSVLLGILQMQTLEVWLGTSQAAPLPCKLTYSVLCLAPFPSSHLPHLPPTSLPISPPPSSFFPILLLPLMLLPPLPSSSLHFLPSNYSIHLPSISEREDPCFLLYLNVTTLTMPLYPPLTGKQPVPQPKETEAQKDEITGLATQL